MDGIVVRLTALCSQILPEDEGDSVDSKLSAAVVNTLLIISLVVAATVLMVVLFYFHCTKVRDCHSCEPAEILFDICNLGNFHIVFS